MTLIKLFIGMTGSIVSIQLLDFFMKMEFSLITSTLFAGITAALMMLLLQKVTEFLAFRINWLRKLVDPITLFEGTWLILIEGMTERPYSIGSITYEAKKNSHIFSGDSFDIHGIKKAYWNSIELTFDTQKNLLYYRADSAIGTENLQNWGWIYFQRYDFEKKYNRGQGHFVDIGKNAVNHVYYLERLTKEMLEREYEIKELNEDNIKILIQKYHKKIQKRKMENCD